ncbi:MAG: DUF1566 domain-containing protein [Nanoarchaeota archaeon]|nr:DUF1566 domain-containing protein [Nanoarchaeota archaeon]
MTWLNSHSETDRAAQLCDALNYGGYTDWFLPSKDELNLMFKNLKVNGIGGFADDDYWSSSVEDAGDAWNQYFLDGTQYGNDMDLKRWVRAVRAF